MRKDLKIYIPLIMSIIFIPAAYIYMAAGFVVQMCQKDYRPLTNIRQNKNLIIIFGCIMIGVLFSKYKLISSIYGLMMLICLYSLTYTTLCMHDVNMDKIVKIIYTISIIVFVLGIIQYLNPAFDIPAKWVDGKEYKLKKRIFSTFFNPNVFGFYINIIIIMICETLDTKKLDRTRMITLITGLICLFLTFSRTAWMSLIISLFMAGIIFDKKYFKYALIIAFFIISIDYMLDTGRSDPSKVVDDSSIYYRMKIWQASYEIIKDNPISGIGFGTLFKYIPQYSSVVSPNVEHYHNAYIQIATETGIIGVCGFLYIAIDTSKSLWHKLKTAKTNKQKTWLNTTMIIIIMTMIHSTVDSVPLTPQIMMILSILIGVAWGENKKGEFDNAKSS